MHSNRIVTVSLTPTQYENAVRTARRHGLTPAEWFAVLAEPTVTEQEH